MILAAVSGNLPAGVPGNIRKCIPRFSYAPFLPMSCHERERKGCWGKRGPVVYIFLRHPVLTSNDCDSEDADEEKRVKVVTSKYSEVASTLSNCCFSYSHICVNMLRDNLPWKKYIIYCLQPIHEYVFSYGENSEFELSEKRGKCENVR